jgi:hypothetical protein
MRFSFETDGPAPLVPCALQQHPRYAAALARIGADAACVTVRDGDRVCATAWIVRRRIGPVRLAWIPRGPVWAFGVDDGLRQHILRTLPLRGLRIAQPDAPADRADFTAAGYRALLAPPSVAELDLTPDKDQRLKACHGKWRNRLRHAQAGDLTTTDRPLDPGRDRPLLDLEARQRRDRRYTALPPAFTLAWAASGPKTTRLFLAHDGPHLAAFVLVLLHAQTATYHIGWTDPVGRRLSAHNLLLWQASNWLAERGYARFDLGSIDTTAAPGLARFKLGIGARARALGPTMLRLPGLVRPMRAA